MQAEIAHSLPRRLSARALTAAGLGLVALAALALRLWRLDALPPGFHYDEAYEALEAWRVVTQTGYHPLFFPGNFGVEPLFIYLTAGAFALTGPSPLVMRSVAALLGALTVLAVYALGVEWTRVDRRLPAALPWLAAAALAVMRWHIHFSRVGIEPVLIPLLLTVLLWAYLRLLRTGGLLPALILGVAAGLGPYAYPAGRLLPPLAALLALIALLASPDRALRTELRRFALAGLVTLLVLTPLALHFAQHPDQLLLRSSQIAVAPGGESGGVLGNLLAALGMFSARGDPDPRSNLPGRPALDPLLGLAFYLGLAQTEQLEGFVAARRANARHYTELLCQVPGMITPPEAPWAKNVFWMYGIMLGPEYGISRDELRRRLAQRGIETRTFFIPMHCQPIYFDQYRGQRFPVAEDLCRRGLYLPSASNLMRGEIESVVEAVAECRAG